jgi:hypothetical protein
MSDMKVHFIQKNSIQLRKNEQGDTIARLEGEDIEVGHILSIFPISNRSHFISLRDTEGREIGIIEQAHELDPESKNILKEELELSHFLPKIKDIFSVEDNLGLFTFEVLTDKGMRMFEVRNPRQNIRDVGRGRFIIKDVDGNRYEIRKLRNLGPKSQNLMREFV